MADSLQSPNALDDQLTSEFIEEAFVYGFATVDLYRILHSFALDPGSPEFKAPVGLFGHSRALASPNDRTVVAMNVDTSYSYAWLDLRAEPVVLAVPPFEPERYVSVQLNDLYTYIVGYVSPRTNGNAGGTFLLAGPHWNGEAPSVVDRVFSSPTELLLVLARTQLFDDADLPNVMAIQNGLEVTPLSAFVGAEPPPAAPVLDPVDPLDPRGEPTTRFFDVLEWMLSLMPVLGDDRPIRGRLAQAGIVPGRPVGVRGREDVVLAAMRAGMSDVVARARTVRSSAELFGTRQHFAGDHLSRACGAFLGILGNAAEEFLGVGWQADADSNPFDGSRRYEIRFAPGGLPPVGAFWSITVYTADRFLYANELDRYVVNSLSLPSLAPDEDGGVTIHVQHVSPGRNREANWLPCPDGPFGLTLRTYLPGEAIRSGAWTAPPVRPVG